VTRKSNEPYRNAPTMAKKSYYQDKLNQSEKMNKDCIKTHTICELAEDWLANPRRAHKKKESQQKNIRQTLNKFRPILNRYAPRDLENDDVYFEFIQWFKDFIEQTELEKSTLDTYFPLLYSKLLVSAKVDQRIIDDLKSDITGIRKKLKHSEPICSSISDKDLLVWFEMIDKWCKNLDLAPNVVAIASPRCSMAKSPRTSEKHLIALRAYAWLAISLGGRADEIRRIQISKIRPNSITREIMKMKIYTQSVSSEIPSWIMDKITPYVDYCKNTSPEAIFLFSESGEKMGRGTISASTLNRLVKGSMIAAGLSPTTPGGYHRIHDLRKVWARWIDQNGGTIEESSAFLTHATTDVTYKTYYSHDHKEELRKTGHSKGISKLEELLNQRDELDVRIRELSNEIEKVGFWSSGDGGGIHPSCWITDNDPEIFDLNSSGLQEIGSPSRIRTRVVGSRTPHDGPLH